jgi:hypothetical protein
VRCDERTTRSHRLIEERAEHFWFIAISCGVLFPDQGIRGYREERIEIVAAKWAEVQQLAAQNRLKIGLRHTPGDG